MALAVADNTTPLPGRKPVGQGVPIPAQRIGEPPAGPYRIVPELGRPRSVIEIQSPDGELLAMVPAGRLGAHYVETRAVRVAALLSASPQLLAAVNACWSFIERHCPAIEGAHDAEREAVRQAVFDGRAAATGGL